MEKRNLAFQFFDFERIWGRLFQKRVVRTKLDIYVVIEQVRYITMETKEVTHIGYNGFLFTHSSSCEKENRHIQYGLILLFQ
jgi:hypothetical protein